MEEDQAIESISTLEQDNEATKAAIKAASSVIRCYGMFWEKRYIHPVHRQMLGFPTGHIGRGVRGKEDDSLCMNFFEQQGVYVLYNSELIPVYAGQAGMIKTKKDEKTKGGTIGDRLAAHSASHFRHGWSLFSWFGLLSPELDEKFKTKDLDIDARRNVVWVSTEDQKFTQNQLLAALEAILIYGFQPRFNARGGDLGSAIYVDQANCKPLPADSPKPSPPAT